MKFEAIRLLADLVSIPTVTEDIEANDQAIAYIDTYLKKRGMFTKRFKLQESHGALMAFTRRNNAKRPAVLLAAHVDVVAGSSQLFTLREQEGKLLGRGVYDMKFAIASYMALVDELADNLKDYDFAIMITSDEEPSPETMGNGVQQLLAAGYTAPICILPDSAAPGWDIEEKTKTAWRFKLIANGQTAHGSRPWEGDSASFKLLGALHELKELFKDHGPLTDTLNIGIINGGVAYNQIPDRMEAAIEIRLVDADTQPQLLETVRQMCATYDLTYEEHPMRPTMKTDLSNPLVQSYMDAVEAVTGRRPEGIMSFASSDGPYFVAAGVPCIVSCPRGGGHHSEDEWLDRDQFLQFVPILRHYLDKHAKNTSVDTKAQTV